MEKEKNAREGIRTPESTKEQDTPFTDGCSIMIFLSPARLTRLRYPRVFVFLKSKRTIYKSFVQICLVENLANARVSISKSFFVYFNADIPRLGQPLCQP